MRLDWQVAIGSTVAHIIDSAKPTRRRGERGWKSGPRSICGRYPQRNLEDPWFAYEIGPEAEKALRSFGVQACADCWPNRRPS